MEQLTLPSFRYLWDHKIFFLLGFKCLYFSPILSLIYFELLATYFSSMRWVHSYWYQVVSFMLLFILLVEVQRRHRLLATSTGISSFSPKLNANLRTMRGYIHGKLGSQLFNLILLNFLLSVWLLLFILFFESYFFIGFDLVLLLHYGTFMVLLGHSLLAQSYLWRHESSCNPMKPDLRVAVSSVTTCRMLARG